MLDFICMLSRILLSVMLAILIVFVLGIVLICIMRVLMSWIRKIPLVKNVRYIVSSAQMPIIVHSVFRRLMCLLVVIVCLIGVSIVRDVLIRDAKSVIMASIFYSLMVDVIRHVQTHSSTTMQQKNANNVWISASNVRIKLYVIDVLMVTILLVKFVLMKHLFYMDLYLICLDLQAISQKLLQLFILELVSDLWCLEKWQHLTSIYSSVNSFFSTQRLQEKINKCKCS